MSFKGNISVKLNLSTYAKKSCYLKGETGFDSSNVAAKSDLASLKAEVDKIVADKLKTVLVDLSKVINVVNNKVV